MSRRYHAKHRMASIINISVSDDGTLFIHLLDDKERTVSSCPLDPATAADFAEDLSGIADEIMGYDVSDCAGNA